MRGAVATLLLALLAACGDPPPRPPVAGPEARKAVDAATAAYGSCIEDGARAAAPGGVPGTVIAGVVRDCRPARDDLAAKIATFHKLGHPNFTPPQLKVVADASIQQIEPELRAAGVVAYFERNAAQPKAP